MGEGTDAGAPPEGEGDTVATNRKRAPLLSRAVDWVGRIGVGTATTAGVVCISCLAGGVVFLGFRRGFRRVVDKTEVRATRPDMRQGLAIILGGFLTSTAILGGATYAVASRFESMEDFDATMRRSLSDLPYVQGFVDSTSRRISPLVDESKVWLADGVQSAMAKVGLGKLGSSVLAAGDSDDSGSAEESAADM